MTKPTITKRSVKGAALTYNELDTNFQNLADATLALTAGTGGTQVTSDLNGNITLVAGTGITLSGNNTSKEITITSTSGSNAFSTIAVSGQSSVVADSTSDTLTLVAGTNISITTNATNDIITITGASGTIQAGDQYDFAFYDLADGSQRLNNSPALFTDASDGLHLGTNLDLNGSSIDSYSTAASYTNGATVNFSNFSGMVMINRQDTLSGNVALWLCGGGVASKLGDSQANASGTISGNGAVNGYTWTNNTGVTITASFMLFRGRTGG